MEIKFKNIQFKNKKFRSDIFLIDSLDNAFYLYLRNNN